MPMELIKIGISAVNQQTWLCRTTYCLFALHAIKMVLRYLLPLLVVKMTSLVCTLQLSIAL